jgi:hypothetical protein
MNYAAEAVKFVTNWWKAVNHKPVRSGVYQVHRDWWPEEAIRYSYYNAALDLWGLYCLTADDAAKDVQPGVMNRSRDSFSWRGVYVEGTCVHCGQILLQHTFLDKCLDREKNGNRFIGSSFTLPVD